MTRGEHLAARGVPQVCVTPREVLPERKPWLSHSCQTDHPPVPRLGFGSAEVLRRFCNDGRA
jgi:hypothetical protein